MHHTEARARLLAMYIAAGGLKEYKADWLKNANTVVRDTSGRFASKASNVKQAVEQKTASVKEDLTNVGRLGKVGIESIDLLRKDKDFRRRAGLATGMLMAKTVDKLTDNPQIEKHIEELSAEVTAEFSEAFGDDKSPFAQALRKSGKALPEGGSFKERLENAALVAEAYKDALKEPEDYNKFQEDLGNAARATIPVAVSIAIAVAPEVLIPIFVEGTVDLGTVLTSLAVGQVADKMSQFGMDLAHVESPWTRMAMSVVSGIVTGNLVSKYLLKSTKVVALEGTRSAAEIEKKMLPKLKKIFGKQKEKVLSLKGVERDRAILKAHGFDSVKSLDKKILDLLKKVNVLEGVEGKTKERVGILREVEELLALSNQTTTIRHAEVVTLDIDKVVEQLGGVATETEVPGIAALESLAKSVGASRQVLRAEEEFGADLDKVLFASNPQEAKAAHAALLKKLKRREKVGNPQFQEEFVDGTPFGIPKNVDVEKLPWLLKRRFRPGKFSDEEKKLCQKVSDDFSEIFGFDSSKIVFVKHPLVGPYCAPLKGGKYQISIDEVLKRSKIAIKGKKVLDATGRLPPSLSVDEMGIATIFHELCHTLEQEKRELYSMAQDLIYQKGERVHVGVLSRYSKILEDYGQSYIAKSMSPAKAELLHQVDASKYEHITEFLSTAGEKLMDPKSLQVGLRNDREKILFLLSQVLEQEA